MDNLAFTDDVFKKLMPQKEPMLLCDGIVASDLTKNHQLGVYTVGSRLAVALTENGELPAVCLMEVMAQTVAGVLSGRRYLYEADAALKAGLFLSVRGFKMLKHYPSGFIPKGTKLYTEIDFSEGVEGVVLAEAVTTSDGEEIAKARLTVLSPSAEELARAVGEKAAQALLS